MQYACVCMCIEIIFLITHCVSDNKKKQNSINRIELCFVYLFIFSILCICPDDKLFHTNTYINFK